MIAQGGTRKISAKFRQGHHQPGRQREAGSALTTRLSSQVYLDEVFECATQPQSVFAWQTITMQVGVEGFWGFKTHRLILQQRSAVKL